MGYHVCFGCLPLISPWRSLPILDTLFHGDRHRCRNYLHIFQTLFLVSVKLLFISGINDGNKTCFSKKRV